MFKISNELRVVILFLVLTYIWYYWIGYFINLPLWKEILGSLQLLPQTYLFFVLFILQEIFLLLITYFVLEHNIIRKWLYWFNSVIAFFKDQLKIPKWQSFIVLIFGSYLLMIVTLSIISFISNILPFPLYGLNWIQKSAQFVGNMAFSNVYDIILIWVCIVLIAPIVEEIIYRGMIARLMINKFWQKIWILSSSFIFAFIHWEMAILINLFIMWVFLTYIYNKSGSLYYSIFYHIFINWIAFSFILLN